MNATTKPDQFIWTDADNRRWSAYIKLDDAVRLRETQSIDLLDPHSMEQLFGTNPLTRIEAMAELARRHWTDSGLQYTDFADALISTETSFEMATAALRAAIADFSRRLGRNDLAIVSERAWAAMDLDRRMRESKASGEKVGSVLEAARARSAKEVDEQLDRALAEIAGKPSGN